MRAVSEALRRFEQIPGARLVTGLGADTVQLGTHGLSSADLWRQVQGVAAIAIFAPVAIGLTAAGQSVLVNVFAPRDGWTSEAVEQALPTVRALSELLFPEGRGATR